MTESPGQGPPFSLIWRCGCSLGSGCATSGRQLELLALSLRGAGLSGKGGKELKGPEGAATWRDRAFPAQKFGLE